MFNLSVLPERLTIVVDASLTYEASIIQASGVVVVTFTVIGLVEPVVPVFTFMVLIW